MTEDEHAGQVTHHDVSTALSDIRLQPTRPFLRYIWYRPPGKLRKTPEAADCQRVRVPVVRVPQFEITEPNRILFYVFKSKVQVSINNFNVQCSI